jgi:hypothetical protein
VLAVYSLCVLAVCTRCVYSPRSHCVYSLCVLDVCVSCVCSLYSLLSVFPCTCWVYSLCTRSCHSCVCTRWVYSLGARWCTSRVQYSLRRTHCVLAATVCVPAVCTLAGCTRCVYSPRSHFVCSLYVLRVCTLCVHCSLFTCPIHLPYSLPIQQHYIWQTTLARIVTYNTSVDSKFVKYHEKRLNPFCNNPDCETNHPDFLEIVMPVGGRFGSLKQQRYRVLISPVHQRSSVLSYPLTSLSTGSCTLCVLRAVVQITVSLHPVLFRLVVLLAT